MIIDERRGVQVYCPGQASDRQAEASHPLDRAAPGRLRWSDPAAELELLNLAHGGAGQGVQGNHVAGVLVAGEAVNEQGEDILAGQADTGPGDDAGDGGLASGGVGAAHDRGLGNLRAVGQHVQGSAQGTSAGHVLVACCVRGGGARKAVETFGENVAVTETRIQIRISNLNSRDLFACKWLRAHDLNQRPSPQTEGVGI